VPSERLNLAKSTNFWYRVFMNKNTSISLGDHFANFVDDQVAKGRYASASEVVRAGLRLLEEREASLQALRAALIKGERSGASEPFDFDAFIAEKRKSASSAK
jgi:antitoxin ParD1/3/4